MSKWFTLIRGERWWEYKVPLYLAVVYYLFALKPDDAVSLAFYGKLAIFLLAVIGLAGFGHVWNDWFDMEVDTRAGKSNPLARMLPWQRVGVVSGLFVAAFLPWLVLPRNRYNIAGLVTQTILLMTYAAPPFRFKERRAGVIVDALYGYTVPVFITWFTFQASADRVNQPACWSILFWVTCIGIRSILNHQLMDSRHDLETGVKTFVNQIGAETATRLMLFVLLPLEAASFLWVTYYLTLALPFYLPLFLLVVVWRVFQVEYIWRNSSHPQRAIDRYGPVQLYLYLYLNHYYEHWLPILILIGLVWLEPKLLVLALIHLCLFQKNGLTQFIMHDAKGIRWGIYQFRQGGAPQVSREE